MVRPKKYLECITFRYPVPISQTSIHSSIFSYSNDRIHVENNWTSDRNNTFPPPSPPPPGGTEKVRFPETAHIELPTWKQTSKRDAANTPSTTRLIVPCQPFNTRSPVVAAFNRHLSPRWSYSVRNRCVLMPIFFFATFSIRIYPMIWRYEVITSSIFLWKRSIFCFYRQFYFHRQSNDLSRTYFWKS